MWQRFRPRVACWSSLDEGEQLAAVGLTPGNRVVLQGTNGLGRPVLQIIEGEELAKYLLRRARKGALVPKRLKVTGFGRES